MKWAFFLLTFLNAEAAPPLLSQAGLYENIATGKVAADLVEYSPRFPLWSDGLGKSRWIRLPAAPASIDKADPEAWVFPDGTELWKEFRLNDRKIETRRMKKLGEAQWEFVTYVWNDEQTEATLAPATGIASHYPLNPTVAHDIPSQQQCRNCHQRFGDPVLGYSAQQLGTHEVPGHSPMEKAALGYLHANCGSCHHPEGRAGFTENFLQLPLGVTSPKDTPAFVTSVNVATVNFPIPGAETTYRVRPGHPEQSALIYRLTLPGPQHMPSLGTKIVDTEAVELLTTWVRSLPR